MTDVANDPSKNRFVYDRLSFRVYDCERPRLDTEWLLSTLFDASLLSTSKAAGNGGSLFVPAIVRWSSVLSTQLIHRAQRKP
jgi:hypothetical protein